MDAAARLFASFDSLRGLVNCAGVVGDIAPILAYSPSRPGSLRWG